MNLDGSRLRSMTTLSSGSISISRPNRSRTWTRRSYLLIGCRGHLPDAAEVGMVLDDRADHVGERTGRQPGEDGLRIAADPFSPLAEEPLEQPVMPSRSRGRRSRSGSSGSPGSRPRRGTSSARTGRRHRRSRSSVYIPFFPEKTQSVLMWTIRIAPAHAELGEQMREERVDGDARHRVVRLLQLLHDPDAVDRRRPARPSRPPSPPWRSRSRRHLR